MSEQSKCVPGPWEASFADMGGYDMMSDAWDVRDGLGRLIASTDLGKRPTKEHARIVEANARLMAASPELYEALRTIVHNYDTGNYAAIDMPAARAALARVHGEAEAGKDE